MIYDLDLTVVLTAAGIAGLAAVYVWSKVPDRRGRAWRLLKLLLGRLLGAWSTVAGRRAAPRCATVSACDEDRYRILSVT